MLNSDQFDSIKAGDFFCRKCPDNGRGITGLCYWWHYELEDCPTSTTILERGQEDPSHEVVHTPCEENDAELS